MKNRNYISESVDLDKGAILEEPVTIYSNADIRDKVKIGSFTIVNGGTTIFYQTAIGRYCSIGKNCEIGPVDHPIEWLSSSAIQYNIADHFPDYRYYCDDFPQLDIARPKGTTVGHDVWIGSLVVIKRGVNIGNGAIVGAGSVVVKDVPPYAIVGGVPAKIIRYRFDLKTVARLLKIQWWNRELKDLAGIQFDDINRALDQLEKQSS